ncbi:MAG: hypothetical protein ACRBCS_02930 [Cellvibrionaceae bacterium]
MKYLLTAILILLTACESKVNGSKSGYITEINRSGISLDKLTGVIDQGGLVATEHSDGSFSAKRNITEFTATDSKIIKQLIIAKDKNRKVKLTLENGKVIAVLHLD